MSRKSGYCKREIKSMTYIDRVCLVGTQPRGGAFNRLFLIEHVDIINFMGGKRFYLKDISNVRP